MTGIWWTSVSIEIFLCSLTATTAHLLMSLGQTLFHRYLGHRGIGGRFFENHLHIHHRHYSGNHVISEYYLNEEANNTPFFLIPVTLVISLGYLFLPLDLFIVQLTAMSISFYVHLYFDKHYHVAGSWLGRFAWFRRKQQLHFLHHRYADCNFAVVDKSSIIDYPLIRRRIARFFVTAMFRSPSFSAYDAHYRVDLGPHLHTPLWSSRCCSRFEERRRFGRLEGGGSALGDDVPFAPFPCLLADLPGWHAIVRKRLKE